MGGILTALSIAIMWASVFIGTITLSAAAVAAFCLFIPLASGRTGLSWLVYAASSLLSAFIVPQKETALCYILAFGIYNLLKWEYERHFGKVLSWLLKCATFAVSVFVLIKVSELFAIPIFTDSFPLPAITTGAFVIFLLYDIALTRVIRFFLPRLLKRLGI